MSVGSRLLCAGMASLLLAACAQRGAQGEPTSPVPSEIASPKPTATAEASDTEESDVPEDVLTAIIADAAQRAGVSADDIEVKSADAVTFTDGSLDCPEPGMMYTQALVDGYRVVVDVAGEELDYRVGSGGSFRLCEGGGTGTGSKNES